MKSHEKIWTYVAIMLGLPILVFVLVSWYESRISGLPVLGPDKHQVGDFNFVNQHNKNVSNRDWDKKIVVAGFFFTHCPVVCPTMISNLKAVYNQAGENVSINTFTVDPEHDNVERFVYYSNRFDIAPDWNLLTGSKKDLYRFARKELMVVATDGDGGPTDFIHSDNFVLIDPQKRIRGYYKGTNKKDVQQLIRDINKLKREYSLD